MKLQILTGRIARPQKAVLFGPEGIGKSTLAAQFPAPVFLDTEGGTHHLDVARLPAPKSWDDVTKAAAALATEAHDFKTLVIDTADWLEKLLVDHVCKAANKASIEDFGYGKGYVVLAEEFTKFLASLDPLLRRGMHVLLLAHTRIVKFEQPDAAGAYDRYELKLSKQVGPLLKEWCDVLLFANYFTKVAENDSGRKRGERGAAHERADHRAERRTSNPQSAEHSDVSALPRTRVAACRSARARAHRQRRARRLTRAFVQYECNHSNRRRRPDHPEPQRRCARGVARTTSRQRILTRAPAFIATRLHAQEQT